MPTWPQLLGTAFKTLLLASVVLAAVCFVALRREVTEQERSMQRHFMYRPAPQDSSPDAVNATILRAFWYEGPTMHEPSAGKRPLAIDLVIERAQPGFDPHEIRIDEGYRGDRIDSFPDVRYLDEHGNMTEAPVTSGDGQSVPLRLIYLAPPASRFIRLTIPGVDFYGAASIEEQLP